MADKNQIAAVLEHLLNNEQQKAEEIFHEYVVGKSREIYENLIDSEIDEEVKDEDLDETADEDLDETNEDDLDENFEDITAEGDDETGDLETDIAAAGEEDEEEFGGEEEGEEEGDDDEPATKGDLKDIVDELEAAFAKYAGGDHAEPDADNMGGPSDMDMDNMPGMMKDEFDLETVREYVEKVPAGHGAEKKGAAEKADNTKSTVAGKNDMGGTTANILSSKEDSPSYAGAGGTIKGNGLTKQKPQDMNTGNVNVVGGTNAKAFYSKNSQGHGAEKKGTAESGVDTTSIIRGSR
jgi:hypothetical protein